VRKKRKEMEREDRKMREKVEPSMHEPARFSLPLEKLDNVEEREGGLGW